MRRMSFKKDESALKSLNRSLHYNPDELQQNMLCVLWMNTSRYVLRCVSNNTIYNLRNLV